MRDITQARAQTKPKSILVPTRVPCQVKSTGSLNLMKSQSKPLPPKMYRTMNIATRHPARKRRSLKKIHCNRPMTKQFTSRDNYAVLQIGGTLAAKMASATLCEWTPVGITIGLVYRPREI